MRSQLDREIISSTERVREAIAPYTRYVRAEGNRLELQRSSLLQVAERLGKLRAEITPGG